MRVLVALASLGLLMAGCAAPAPDDAPIETAAEPDAEPEPVIEKPRVPVDPTVVAEFSASWMVGAKTPDPAGLSECQGTFTRMGEGGASVGYADIITGGEAGTAFLTIIVETVSAPEVTFQLCASIDNGVKVDSVTGKAPFSLTFALPPAATTRVYVETAMNDAATTNVDISGSLIWTLTDPREGNVTSAE